MWVEQARRHCPHGYLGSFPRGSEEHSSCLAFSGILEKWLHFKKNWIPRDFSFHLSSENDSTLYLRIMLNCEFLGGREFFVTQV